MKKERLDLLLVARGFAASRERAKRLIMAGQVLVDEQRVDKAGTTVSPLSSLRVVGGFTDCMLQNGAAKVYAIDVGYGQLDWKLRTDTRVVNMERTNIRNVTAETLGQPLDFASIDVAFISLDKVLPVVRILLKDDGETIALIKPQFEAGKEHVGKNGVVRDPTVHTSVIRAVLTVAEDLGFIASGLTFSPIKGPKGNIEYLLHLTMGGDHSAGFGENTVAAVVAEAHRTLDG